MPNIHPTPGTNPMSYSSSPSMNQAASPDPKQMNNMINRTADFNQMAQTSAWAPTDLISGNQDIPMLDIDWTEWDKLFPLEMNNGELDMPKNAQLAH